MKTAWPILGLIVGSMNASGEAHCSLLVKIVDPNGQDVPEALVRVEEKNGRVVRTENRLGGVRFCDLGLLPVAIVVGSPNCNEVSLRNVPLEWGRTKTVKVFYDEEPCVRDLPPVAACNILFRFSDEKGKGISGVSFEPPVSGAEHPNSDAFGRTLVSIAAGSQLRAAAKREGYVAQNVHLTCTRELMVAERVVTMRKQR